MNTDTDKVREVTWVVTVLAALFFHTAFSDQNQTIHFMKNLAIAGGFLTLYANGPGQWSIDRRMRRG